MRKLYSKELLVGIPFFIGLILIWQIIASIGIFDELFLPSPISIIQSGINLFVNKGFTVDIVASVSRVIIGFILATILGVPLGVISSNSEVLKNTFLPFIQFIRYIPPSAFLPLSILWFGIGFPQKIFIIFLTVFPYIVFYTMYECIKTPQVLIDTAKLLGMNKNKILSKVIFPFALPGIWLMLEVEMGAAWSMIIIAELIATKIGIGAMMIESQRFLVTSNIFAGMLILGFIGLLSSYLFRKSYKRLFKWRKEISY